jgi:hypothetical protein
MALYNSAIMDNLQGLNSMKILLYISQNYWIFLDFFHRPVF